MFKVTIYQQKQGPAFRVVLGDHASGEFETTAQVTVCEHSERDGAIDAAIAVTGRDEIRAQLLRMRAVAPVKFVARFNMPGCMPESDPVECDTFDEAKREIIRELLRAADDTETEEDAETFTHTAEDVNLESGPFCTPTMPDGYVYVVN